MDPAILVPLLFVGVPVLLFGGVKLLLWQRRKAAWREAAALLGASHTGEKLLGCGVLEGERNGRRYRLAQETVRGSNGGYAVTVVTVPVGWHRIPLHFGPDFFASGDLAAVTTRQKHDREVRVFVTHVTMEQVEAAPLPADVATRLTAAFADWRPAATPVGNPVGRETVTVHRGEARFSARGVITDPRRLEALVATVTDVAARVERAAP